MLDSQIGAPRSKSGGESWEDLKEGMDKAFADMKKSLGKALSRMKRK